MKAASPKASNLVPATLTPAAAAARSLPRTVRNRRPVPERRTFTTSRASSSTKIRHRTPNQTLGGTTSVARMPKTLSLTLFGPKSFPPILGGGTASAPVEPASFGFLNTSSSMATAAASVTTARLTPRTRRAGTAMANPKSAATSAATIGPSGKGQSLKYLDEREAGRPRDRPLGQRDLPDEPGQHHQRQGDHGEDEGVDDGLTPVEAEAEQPDERGRDGQHRERRHVAGRAARTAGGHRRWCPARAGSCPARTWR